MKIIPCEYKIISIQIQGEIYCHLERLVELAQRCRSQTNTTTNHIIFIVHSMSKMQFEETHY